MRCVTEEYLLQTFDKKVMSHGRKKMTEHEARKAKHHAGGSGMLTISGTLGQTEPTAFGDTSAMGGTSLVSSGAAGAFVHGLEDEFYEVREATVVSICSLSGECQVLAQKALDFLADMFNDEIDSVGVFLLFDRNLILLPID